MKPDTTTAMQQLMGQIRAAIPLDTPESTLCSDHCRVCSKKLLEFMGAELDAWEYKLAQGGQPNFGDLQRLARVATKVHKGLQKSGLINLPQVRVDMSDCNHRAVSGVRPVSASIPAHS